MQSRSTITLPATRETLDQFSREKLREYAEQLGVDKGRMKSDTIHYLLASGKAVLRAELGTEVTTPRVGDEIRPQRRVVRKGPISPALV